MKKKLKKKDGDAGFDPGNFQVRHTPICDFKVIRYLLKPTIPKENFCENKKIERLKEKNLIESEGVKEEEAGEKNCNDMSKDHRCCKHKCTKILDHVVDDQLGKRKGLKIVKRDQKR